MKTDHIKKILNRKFPNEQIEGIFKGQLQTIKNRVVKVGPIPLHYTWYREDPIIYMDDIVLTTNYLFIFQNKNAYLIASIIISLFSLFLIFISKALVLFVPFGFLLLILYLKKEYYDIIHRNHIVKLDDHLKAIQIKGELKRGFESHKGEFTYYLNGDFVAFKETYYKTALNHQ